jgi:hypothetical protein
MGWRLAHLPVLLVVSAALLVAATALGWLLRGGAGAGGAAAGVGVVTASYLASTLAIAWADSVDPQLVLPVGLGMYVTKFTLIGFGMVAVTATGWAGLGPMGVGVVAGVIAWTATQIWWVVRNQPRLEYTPPATPSGGADGSTARY